MFKIAFASALLVITSGMLAQTRNTDAGNPELARIQSEYSDVLALQGTAKAELLAIARVLRAKPEMAIDRTKAAGDYCFKSSERSEEHTSELQSQSNLVCRLLLEKKKQRQARLTR